jgi:phosphinothricin acetyltransferase
MFHIRDFQKSDFESVKQIYQEGIDTGNATFETQVKEWDAWNSALHDACRLVAEETGRVLGWAALSSVSNRRVYAGVVEVSIYVSNAAQGRGIGHALLSKLVVESEKAGFWTLLSLSTKN